MVERKQLLPALIRNGNGGNELCKGGSISRAVRQKHIAGKKPVGTKRFPVEKHAAGQTKRRIELAFERGVEPRELNAEIAKEAFSDVAPQRLWRLDRLAAAITDQGARSRRKFIALCVPTKIVEVVENENASIRPDRATIKPGGGKPADSPPTTTKSYLSSTPVSRRPSRANACAT